jgi:hypothetical protein
MSARRRSRWLLPLVLLGVCAVLGTVLYDQIAGDAPGGGGNAGSTAGSFAIEALPAEAAFDMPPRETYAAVIERPLFSPTRRPETGAVFTPEAPAEDIQLKLLGVLISSDERFALIKTGESNPAIRVGAGGGIAGWTVKEIHEFSVILERDDETIEIFLQYDDTPPPQPEPPPEEEVVEPPVEEAPPENSSEATTGAVTQ